MIEIILTSNQIWTVPDDWSPVNTIEIIGGGGGGGSVIGRYNFQYFGSTTTFDWRNYSRGGAGGGYAKVENVTALQPKQQISVVVGLGGQAAYGYDLADYYDVFGYPNRAYVAFLMAVTGLHYNPGLAGFTTGITFFGNYMSVYGGRYSIETTPYDKFFSHIGGDLNFFNWPAGTYSNFITGKGEDKRYLDLIPGRGQQINTSDPLSFGGAAGGPGFLNYGRGGQGQTALPNFTVWGNRYGTTGGIDPTQFTKPALSGQNGVVRITYEPYGTQQSCVWIS